MDLTTDSWGVEVGTTDITTIITTKAVVVEEAVVDVTTITELEVVDVVCKMGCTHQICTIHKVP